jgi:hypothetical protein
MKLANIIEGGITGATTLSLIQEALHKVDSGAPRQLLHKSGTIKKLKKHAGKKGGDTKLYVKLAGELLGAASYFGLTGLGKKKNAVLRGGLLGATAGLATAFLDDEGNEETPVNGNLNGRLHNEMEELKKKVMTVVLFTAGGMQAGGAIKKINKRRLKKSIKKMKKK